MRHHAFAWFVYHLTDCPPDWRWRRAAQLAAGRPLGDHYADDVTTRRAVRVVCGDPDPRLADVRAARAVFDAGGWGRRLVEAYLLTELTEAEAGGRVGVPAGVVRAYRRLFFAVRGNGPLARRVRALACQSTDRLRADAVRLGPLAVDVRAAIETGVGVDALPPELVERFERADLLARVWADENLAAYVRAVGRMQAIAAGRPPGTLHRPRPRRAS